MILGTGHRLVTSLTHKVKMTASLEFKRKKRRPKILLGEELKD